MKTVDLFCGCGGLSLGFQLAGLDVVASFDNWPIAVETYRKNFKHPVYCGDISSPEVHNQIQNFAPGVIIGGPPCQDFSSAGKRDEDLGRGDLSITFAKIIALAQPKYFVMENVERIVKSRKLKEVQEILSQAGYTLHATVLDASLCGVPQKRKRFIMFGSKNLDIFLLNSIIQGKLSPKPLTIREYMGKEIDIDYYYRHPRSYARRAIFSIDEPSPTIRGVNRPVPKGYLGHEGDATPLSENIRPLTFEERCRIQTFPDNFIFGGNKSEKEQMLGNAVPVNLGKFVGSILAEYNNAVESRLVVSSR